MQLELFEYCKHCHGRGFVGDYEPCPKCDWKPKKLSELGEQLVEFLEELKVHIEIPEDWR